ncbi:hypothetical protein [Desulfofalx alkaliphila]|uniref:hypothetical protein n=1 Tax=Desulfofalx alkaliphila TaxID=105483 RepID=UPI0004E141E3|nr:hypothetical protein [Desulfofalx alkaliphila]
MKKFIFSGFVAGLFVYYIAIIQQAMTPIYHNMVLFCVTWMLFYVLVDLLVEPFTTQETNSRVKIRKKVKNTPKESSL